MYSVPSTAVSADTPDWFKPSVAHVLPRKPDPDARLAASPTRASATIGRGNVRISDEPVAPEVPTSSKTRNTLDVDDRASKNRYTDPESMEFRYQQAVGKNPASLRRTRGPLESYLETTLALRSMVPSMPSHQRLSVLRDALPSSLGKSASASSAQMQQLYKSGTLLQALSTDGPTSGAGMGRTGSSSRSPSSPGGKSMKRTGSGHGGRFDSTTGSKAEDRPESPYARDPWMQWVKDGRVTTPSGLTIEVPNARPSTSMAAMHSPIQTKLSRSPTAGGTRIKLPGQHRPWTTAGSTGGRSATNGSMVSSGSRAVAWNPSSPLSRKAKAEEDQKSLVARGLLQARSLMRLSTDIGQKDLGAGFFEAGSWEEVIHPEKQKSPFAASSRSPGGKVSKSKGASGTFSKSSTAASKDAGFSGASSTLQSQGSFLPPSDMKPVSPGGRPTTSTGSPSRTDLARTEALDALSTFELTHQLLSPANRTKKELRAKIRSSGRMSELGFEDDDALNAAPKERLVEAYEILKPTPKAPATTAVKSSPKASSPAVSSPSSGRPRVQLNTAAPSPSSGRSRLTPRSTRALTTSGMLSPANAKITT